MILSEIKGERALDVLAELLDPVTEIAVDPEVVKAARAGKKMQAAYHILKHHKKQDLAILALLDGVPADGYEPSLPEIIVKTVSLLNDPVFVSFFSSLGQTRAEASSGSVTGNTEGKNM